MSNISFLGMLGWLFVALVITTVVNFPLKKEYPRNEFSECAINGKKGRYMEFSDIVELCRSKIIIK